MHGEPDHNRVSLGVTTERISKRRTKHIRIVRRPISTRIKILFSSIHNTICYNSNLQPHWKHSIKSSMTASVDI